MLLDTSLKRSGKPTPNASSAGFRASLGLLWVSLVLIAAVAAQAAGTGTARGGSGTKHETIKTRPAKAPAPEPESGSATGGPRLDSARVHTLYVEGEFDQAISVLEANLRDTRQYNHNDSVFIFKHLGVMYAASEGTREKGRYYMNRLLMVEPSAKIMDMYASDMIYMIFKNIQEEYQESHAHAARPETAPVGRPTAVASPTARSRDSEDDGHPAAREEPRKGGSGYVWLGAAAVAVAAGAATWYYIAEEKPKVVVQDHQPE